MSYKGQLLPSCQNCADLYEEFEALQKKYDELTGEKFSDRCHAALKSRAEVAEARVKELEGQHDDYWQATCKSICDEWNEACAEECNSVAHDEKCASTQIIEAMRQRRLRAEAAEAELRAERELADQMMVALESIDDTEVTCKADDAMEAWRKARGKETK